MKIKKRCLFATRTGNIEENPEMEKAARKLNGQNEIAPPHS
jgi:hypothetical protein